MSWMVSIQVGQGTYRAGINLPTHHEAEVESARQRAFEKDVTHSYVAKSGTVFPTPKVQPYQKADGTWGTTVKYADGTIVRLTAWHPEVRSAVSVADRLLVASPLEPVVLEPGAPPKPSTVVVRTVARRALPPDTLTLSFDL